MGPPRPPIRRLRGVPAAQFIFEFLGVKILLFLALRIPSSGTPRTSPASGYLPPTAYHPISTRRESILRAFLLTSPSLRATLSLVQELKIRFLLSCSWSRWVLGFIRFKESPSLNGKADLFEIAPGLLLILLTIWIISSRLLK
jgi:hypothetical protein